jgi:light-regulated signal transduction histidine kinase (bacteriophytochrome)
LQNAFRELETFAYSISHDLKTPLRAINGFSHILMEDYGPQLDEAAHDYLNRMQRAAVKMGQLIDDLLIYSRQERRELVIGWIELPRVIKKLLAEEAETIAENKVRVDVSLRCPALTAEPIGLEEALRNLIDNAVKFCSKQPKPIIEIGSREDDQHYFIWVKDNGIGFDMQYHERIYGVFQRLVLEDDFPGTGLGLALVKKAMDRVNGRVWAVSAPGQGATFYLEIPKSNGHNAIE